MELIPAMALLMLAAGASLRMFWTGIEGHRSSQMLRLRPEAMEICRLAGEPANGEVFLVWKDAKGSWQWRRFPDLSWLPEGHQEGAFLFRSIRVVGEGGFPYQFLEQCGA